MSSDEEDYNEEVDDVDDDAQEEEEDDDDNAYLDDDDAWLAEEDFKPKPKEEKDIVQADKFAASSGSKEATQRLVRDLNNILKSDTKKFGVSAEPVGDNLYIWKVKFFGFEASSELGKDLEKCKKTRGIDDIELEMRFPPEYPFKPPFIYVKRPRFQFHTGHVTIGGSVCMELLTSSGWTPTNDIESILVQIRSEMLAGGARLDFANPSDYTEQEAKAAFVRVATAHGWNIK
jgi:ubiquitin-conjugating enzyme E2 Q